MDFVFGKETCCGLFQSGPNFVRASVPSHAARERAASVITALKGVTFNPFHLSILLMGSTILRFFFYDSVSRVYSEPDRNINEYFTVFEGECGDVGCLMINFYNRDYCINHLGMSV